MEKFGQSRSPVRNNSRYYFQLLVLGKDIVAEQLQYLLLFYCVNRNMCVFYCRFLNTTAFKISCIMEFIFPEVLLFIRKLER